MGYLLEAIGPSAVAILNGGSKYQNYKMNRGHEKLIPYIELTAGGRVKSLESFGAYVVRQLGFSQPDDCSRLSKVAEDYLRGDKSSSDQSQENIVAYLSSVYPEEEIESLQKELICELDGCMLSYFAFHWQHSPFVINQILHGNSTSKNKLRAAVLSATRKQRFERVMKTLRTKNLFSTLVEQMKTIGHQSNNESNLIGRKEGNQKLLLDPEAIKAVSKLSFLNEDAQSVYELYNSLKDGNKLDKVWKDVVLSSERESRQNYLQIAIQRIESSLLKKTTSDLNSSSFSSSSFSSSNFSRQSSSDSFSDFSWQSSISGPEQNNDGTEIDSSANPDYPKEADSCIHSIISDCSVCTVDSIMYNYS